MPWRLWLPRPDRASFRRLRFGGDLENEVFAALLVAADAGYAPSLAHARVAAKMAAGLLAPTPTELPRYDVAPVANALPAPGGTVTGDEVVVALRAARGPGL